MTWRKRCVTAVGLLGVLGAALAPHDVTAQPVTCPAGEDTRLGQIKRGVCVAQKMRGIATGRDNANRVCELEIPCVVGMCQVARNTCKGILDPICNHGGIELPADGPAFRNAACRAARGPCAAAPTAEEQRICSEIQPNIRTNIGPDKEERKELQWVNPKFEVVSILYAPPGVGSSVTYGESSTLGAKTQLATTFSSSVIVEGSTSAVDVEAGFTFAQTSANSFEVRKSRTSTLGLVAQSDGVTHDYDKFLVWVNPSLVVEKKWYPGGWTRFAMGMRNRDGSRARVVTVTGAQLKNPSLMNADMKSAFTGFTREDFDTILKTNPYMGGNPLDGRLQRLEELQIDGPANTNETVTTKGFELSEEMTRTNSASASNAIDITVMTGGGVSFFVEIGVKVGGKMSFEGVSTTETSAGSGQKASLSLQSTTVGYHEVIDVYFDRVYRTFAFRGRGSIPSSKTASIEGYVREANGSPVAGQVVTVQLPNGTFRRVGTSSTGKYQVFDLPTSGNATVMTATEAKVVSLAQQAKVDVRAANVPRFAPVPKPPPPSAPAPAANPIPQAKPTPKPTAPSAPVPRANPLPQVKPIPRPPK